MVSLLNCEKWTEKEKPKDTGVSLEFNFDTLVNRAKRFVPETGIRGGTLTLPAYSEPVSFNPITAPGALPYMYEGLVRIDGATGEALPCLAKSWEVAEDKMTWTFTVRRDVLWSDSVPFSAYDVAFTFNDCIYNDKINPNTSREMFTIGGKQIAVTALDSTTVQFVLPQVFAPVLTYMSQVILPEHKYGKMVRRRSFSDSLSVKTVPESMVGTGPFCLKSYSSFNNIIFIRNPLYWRRDSEGNALPYLDSIVVIIVSDLEEALQSFKSGELDYLAADGNDYAELKAKNSGYSLHHMGPSLGSNFILFNQNSDSNMVSGKPFVNPPKLKWFGNKMFRRAVSHAINRERIIDVFMNGRGYAQYSPLSPGVGYLHNPAVAQYQYDLKKAESLLKQEGFTDSDNDGFLEDNDSNTVEFSFYVNSGNTFRKNMAEMIVMDLERLGIKVHLQVIDTKIISKKLYNPPYAWDMVMLGLSGGSEPHLAREVWHSSGRHHLWSPKQAGPSTQWERRIDHLFDAGSAILGKAGRKTIYNEWQEIAADELPLIYTVLSERILGISKRIRNVNPTVHGGLLHNIEEFYIISK